MDPAHVCRTCLRSAPASTSTNDKSSSKADVEPFLLPLAQSYISVVQSEEAANTQTRVSYLNCLRQCTQLEVPVMALYANGDFKYPMNICVRCAKALQVAYHFTKLAQETESKLQQLETDAMESHLKRAQSFELEQLDGCNEHSVDMLEDAETTETAEAVVQSQLKFEAENTLIAVTKTEDEQNYYSLQRPASLDDAFIADKWLEEATNAVEILVEPKENKLDELKMIEIDDEYAAKAQYDWSVADIATEMEEVEECDETLTQAVKHAERNAKSNTHSTNSSPVAAPSKKCNIKRIAHDFIINIKENLQNVDCKSKRDLNLVRNKEKMLEDSRELQKAIADNVVQLDDNELVCVQCNARFSDISVFIRHVNHHKGITPFRCNSCNFFTCYSESLRKHYKREHKIEATNDMLDMPINPYIAPMEKPYQEVIYTCKICDHNTHAETDIKVHIMNEHSITKDIDEHFVKAYNCPDCHRQFKDRKAMHVHFTLTHGSAMSIYKTSTEVQTCEYCGKQFHHKNSLTAHQRVCRLREAVHCHICAAKFWSLRKFELHLRHEHAVETIHECEVCSKTFSNPEALSMHRKRHMERHYHCSICPRNYVNSSELKVHMERVHSNEPKVVCSVCGATFSHIGQLRQHENKEHFQTVYKCCYCDYQSTSCRSVRLHEFVHTGKPYKCETCGREFAQRVYLRQHARKAHSIELSDEQLGAMFRQRFGYFSRYDAFSKHNNSLEITEVADEDIEQELEEIGLNVEDVMKELFNVDGFDAPAQ